ncbi:MAG: ASCH domain-containing protein [Mycobacterium leprae]
MDDSIADLWAAFLGSSLPTAAAAADATYTAWSFGSGGQMADELLALVLSGRKTATTSAVWSLEHNGEPIPRIGDYSVITDGAGRARRVIRTTAVAVMPFSEVGAEFAAAEGEGDLSLDYWRTGHWRFFGRELASFGRLPQLDMPVVCERFEVVYPAHLDVPGALRILNDALLPLELTLAHPLDDE